MAGTGLLIHGGGPTSVLNASLAGLALEWRRGPGSGALWGARFGIEGLFTGEFFDLAAQPQGVLEAVGRAPGSAIGTSRRAMEKADYQRAVEQLRLYDIRAVFLTGGNGTMRTALGLARAVRMDRYECQVIGIPKTIDNDLPGTDHTPGYGSAARFFAHAARDVGEDNASLPSPVTVLETLGRDTGWVVGATALARARPDDPPHLIYLPERPVPLDQVVDDVAGVVRRLGRCVVAVCEGLRDPSGEPFGADLQTDRDGGKRLASNLGHSLAGLLSARLGMRVRSEKPGLMGRSNGVVVSEVDRRESFECGLTAALAVRRDAHEVMVALERLPGFPYASATRLVPLAEAAAGLRGVPDGWIAESGNDVTPDFLDFVAPLAGPVEAAARLEPIYAPQLNKP
jgi:6-phosphofructokinase 1